MDFGILPILLHSFLPASYGLFSVGVSILHITDPLPPPFPDQPNAEKRMTWNNFAASFKSIWVTDLLCQQSASEKLEKSILNEQFPAILFYHFLINLIYTHTEIKRATFSTGIP